MCVWCRTATHNLQLVRNFRCNHMCRISWRTADARQAWVADLGTGRFVLAIRKVSIDYLNVTTTQGFQKCGRCVTAWQSIHAKITPTCIQRIATDSLHCQGRPARMPLSISCCKAEGSTGPQRCYTSGGSRPFPAQTCARASRAVRGAAAASCRRWAARLCWRSPSCRAPAAGR